MRRNRAWEERLDGLVLKLGRSARGRDGRLRGVGILSIFAFAERLAQRGHEKRLLRPNGILHYELGTYPGTAELPLAGQPPVRHGERIVILHWANQNVAALRQTFHDRRTMTFQGSRVVRQELRLLADLAESGALSGARVAWTETVLYPMLARFGFCTRPAPRSLRTPFARLYLLGLLAIYGMDVPERISRRPQHLQLGEGWIRLDDLCRYRASPSRRKTSSA